MIQMPAAKAADSPAESVTANAPPAAAKPKTAPGTLAGFMSTQSTAVQENEQLKAQLQVFDGALPTRKLDPATIRPSKWANRDESSFSGPDFEQFKEEIVSAGGNVQPIKVRRIEGGNSGGVGPSNPPGVSFTYEIVFGHRRHRACLELGLPVLALVADTDDRNLFVQMERENRNRADLSAWEQGVMYARALDEGLYPSNRQLASAIGRDLSDVGRAISLARLPKPIIDAFARPLDLQFRWAKPLNDAQQSDPEKLLSRAKALHGKATAMAPKSIFEALVGLESADEHSSAGTVEIKVRGKPMAKLMSDAKGRPIVRFTNAFTTKDRQSLVKLLEGFLQSKDV
ncbi:ParB/RepB/Spo0J family partition protein [Variovorax sp. ZS18.2.2]|uniref:ParB/RepB/Spo0J family partition protein n=1 Tax=Variovorax sp. ZS18.2.2 TaxID=2971255 RepID=UPI002150FFFC|nr:ParB/RepB/Spo0J family partition protein [Variovorax sp. ZS18.2.2]